MKIKKIIKEYLPKISKLIKKKKNHKKLNKTPKKLLEMALITSTPIQKRNYYRKNDKGFFNETKDESDIIVLTEDTSILENCSALSSSFPNEFDDRIELNNMKKKIPNCPNKIIYETLEDGEICDDDAIVSISDDEQIKPKIKKTIASAVIKINWKEEINKSITTPNTYNPNKIKIKSGKRMVIIDGSNVAFGHSNNKYFSVNGLSSCIKFFEKKGHEVKALVPQFRSRYGMTNDKKLFEYLIETEKIILTPSKSLPGKSSCSYDDRIILQVANAFNAVIVSNDNYRDLLNENDDWKMIIETRVIGYTWFKDMLVVPQDPYGKFGPSLEKILNI